MTVAVLERHLPAPFVPGRAAIARSRRALSNDVQGAQGLALTRLAFMPTMRTDPERRNVQCPSESSA
jgi:hypothetical protein